MLFLILLPQSSLFQPSLSLNFWVFTSASILHWREPPSGVLHKRKMGSES
ncbi:hypothetical protein AMTRI_Chr09g17770 [Amborella trichopoda]